MASVFELIESVVLTLCVGWCVQNKDSLNKVSSFVVSNPNALQVLRANESSDTIGIYINWVARYVFRMSSGVVAQLAWFWKNRLLTSFLWGSKQTEERRKHLNEIFNAVHFSSQFPNHFQYPTISKFHDLPSSPPPLLTLAKSWPPTTNQERAMCVCKSKRQQGEQA